MSRESTAIFIVALSVTAVAFVAMLYFDGALQSESQLSVSPSDGTAPPTDAPFSTPDQSAANPASRPPSRIQKCTDQEGSVTYTDLAVCEDVRLGNTLSVIPSPKYNQPTTRQRAMSQPAARQVRKSGGSKAWSPAPIPRDMTVGCKWVIGRAQEVEDLLKKKNPPDESIWKPNYCRWVCEGDNKQCGKMESYLEQAPLCPRFRILASKCSDVIEKHFN